MNLNVCKVLSDNTYIIKISKIGGDEVDLLK